MAEKLTQHLATATKPLHQMRTAVVTGVSATGITLDVAGGEVSAALVGSSSGIYVGATVSVLVQDSTWLVLGPSNGAGNGATNSVIINAILLATTGAIAGGVTTGTGELNSLKTLTGLMPLNHLCEISFGFSFTGTVANTQLGLRIREGATGIAGTQRGSGHGNLAVTIGFSYEAYVVGWVIGDGTVHTYSATVQNLTGGTVTVNQSASAPYLCRITDWGDATGVVIL